jgi:hypothetical protein
LRQATVIATGFPLFFRIDSGPLFSGLAFYGSTFKHSAGYSGLPSWTKCLSVFAAIPFQILQLVINFPGFIPSGCAVWLLKPRFPGLLPEDSILKRTSGFLPMIE